MKESHFHLLVVLNSTNDLTGMRKYGYEFDEILTVLKDLIDKGLVLRTNESIQLTDAGRSQLEDNVSKQKEINMRDSNLWIIPDYKSRLNRKNSLGEPFIPNIESLNRIRRKNKNKF